MRVVDVLKKVNVEHDAGDGTLVSHGSVPFAPELVAKAAAVQHSGERVGLGQLVQVLRLLGQLRMSLIAGGQEFLHLELGLLAIRNVDTSADVAQKPAVGREPRGAGRQHPAIRSVVSAQPTLHLVLSVGLEGLAKRQNDLLAIVRVQAVRPAASALLFEGPARKVKPALVEVLVRLVGTSHPDQHGSGIDQRSGKARFALLQTAGYPVFERAERRVARPARKILYLPRAAWLVERGYRQCVK